MFSIGTPEFLLILLLAFIVFGPKHLPRLGRTAGRLLGEWRKLSRDVEKSIHAATEREPPVKKAASRTRRKKTHAAGKTKRT